MALLHVGLIQFLTGLIRVQGTTENADDLLLASFEYKEVHIRSLRAIYSSFYLAAISFSIMLNSSCLVCLRSKNFNCTQAKLITYHLIEFCCKNDFSYFRVFQVFKKDDDLSWRKSLDIWTSNSETRKLMIFVIKLIIFVINHYHYH